MIERRELRIQRGLLRAHGTRTLEEGLRHHRKKLRGIRRAVRIEETGRSRLVCFPQCFEFPTHHSCPGQVLCASGKRRRAVCARVLEVELMRELVQHQISAVGRIGGAAFDDPIRRPV